MQARAMAARRSLSPNHAMASPDLDEWTPEEMLALGEVFGSGNVEEEMLRQHSPRKQLSFLLAPWRFASVLHGRWEVFGQDMEACGVEPGESHEPDADVWRVTTRQETRTRKWFRVPNGGGDAVLVSTLVWEQTFSVTPSTPYMRRTEGGGYTAELECEEVVEGEKPEGWDEGPAEEEGYTFVSEDVFPVEFLDDDIIRGEEAATSGMGQEVSLAVSDWAVRKRYGRRWASGTTTEFGTFTGAAGPQCSAGSVRRVVYEFELVGWRLSSTIRWTETRIKPGFPDVVEDKEQDIDAGTDWKAQIEWGYPDYGTTTHISRLRIVPV